MEHQPSPPGFLIPPRAPLGVAERGRLIERVWDAGFGMGEMVGGLEFVGVRDLELVNGGCTVVSFGDMGG